MNIQQILSILEENLIGTKKFHELDWKQFTDEMKRMGFSHGKGSFGDVFYKPNAPFVYKVYERDTAYNAFVDYCFKNQSNPHLPKITNKRQIHQIHKRQQHVGDYFWAIKMEQLTPIPEDSNMEYLFDHYTFKILFEYWQDCAHRSDFSELVNLTYVPGNLEKYGAELSWKEIFNVLEVHYSLPDCERVFSTLHDIYLKHPNFIPDIHAGNFMFRGNTLVITDPFYDHSELRMGNMFRQPPSAFFNKQGPRKFK